MQPPMSIPIGRNGEHLVTQVIFDCSKFAEIYGAGIAKIVRKSEKSDILYPIAITQNGNLAVWTITEDDTASVGEEQAELRWYVEESLAKSVQFRFHVTPSITSGTKNNNKAVPPAEPTKAWTEHFEKTVASLEARVRQAEMIAQSVRDDADEGKFNGITPNIQVGEVKTFPPDQPADVGISGPAEKPIVTFGFPQGTQGNKGDTGAMYTPLPVREGDKTTVFWHNDKGLTNPDPMTINDGVSPSVAVTETVTGHEVHIKDASGDHAFHVSDGKTPERGVDFWRPSDKTEIVAEVKKDLLPVDDVLSNTSEHPVQNKVVKTALDGKADREGKYELIESFTLEVDASIEKSAEPDGTPYRFSAALFKFSKPQGRVATNIVFYHDTYPIAGVIYYDYTAADRAFVEVNNVHGYWRTIMGYANDADFGASRLMTGGSGVLNQKYGGVLTRIQTNADLIAGTTVEIWAVRA